MKIELYNVNITGLQGGYSYFSEYTKKFNKIKKALDGLELGIELKLDVEQPRKENGEEQYHHYSYVENNRPVVLTGDNLLKLAVAGIDFKVLQPIGIEVEDINKTFNLVSDKTGEVHHNTYNNRCDVHMPGNMLASYNEIMLAEDSCTDVLQEHLTSGWRMIAVCPQPDQRRPDYILGRWNPDKEISTSAVRG